MTNEDFWDCECEKNYIHAKSVQQKCELCGTNHEDQPDSIDSEVIEAKKVFRIEETDSDWFLTDGTNIRHAILLPEGDYTKILMAVNRFFGLHDLIGDKNF